MNTRPLRVCMLAYAFYETDTRVMRYAEALAQRGDHVDVIALRREGQSFSENLNGVNVFRIQARAVDEKGLCAYGGRLLAFFIRSVFFLTRKQVKTPYHLIHVHSMPDFLVFAAWMAKWKGAKIVLDIHDLLPEYYASKFSAKSDSFLYRILLKVERASSAFAHRVIVANHLWERKIADRSSGPNKCTTMINFVDETVFPCRRKKHEADKFVILFPGTLNWHQGVDLAIRALSQIRDQVPSCELHIYGEGSAKDSLLHLVHELGLQERVLFRDFVPVSALADVMRNADLGVVPKRANGFGNEAFSTKILEFMSVGVPVIVSETAVDRYYFDDSVVTFVRSEDEQDLADSMLELIRDRRRREELSRNASAFVAKYSWGENKLRYLELVDQLCLNAT